MTEMPKRLLNINYRKLAILPLVLGLAACSSSPEQWGSSNESAQKTVKHSAKKKNNQITSTSQSSAMKEEELLYAMLRNEYSHWVGSPYKWGGESINGIDCSSLVQKVFENSFKIDLPRTTEYQATEGYQIKKSELKVGDLVFFKTSRTTRHVGIYMGNNEFFHVSTSKGTKISSLSNVYWSKHYWQSRRVI